MAGGEKDGKTEKPTAKRLGEARKKGQIAKSPELVQWISILIGFQMLQSVAGKASKYCHQTLNDAGAIMAAPDQGKALKFLATSVSGAFMIVLPLTLTFMGIAVAGHIAQTRVKPSLHGLKPSFSKLNPFQGVKKLFSVQNAVQAAKQLVKTVILSFVAYHTVYSTVMSLTTNGPFSTEQVMVTVGKTASTFIREIAAVGVVIGLVDFAYQRRKIGNSLKMTKQEVKDEVKQQDLPPEIRSKLRQKAAQMSRNRMMTAMAGADVVVVNPVHIALALKYDPSRGAPRVIAKGAGFVAEKIREKAIEHHVPIVQDVPLARALHRACDIDDEIPGPLFEAVARVLAFVFSLKKRGTGDGYHTMPGSPSVEETDRLEAQQQAAQDKADLLAGVGAP